MPGSGENLNNPYRDVSNWQIKLSYWYVTHKLKLRKMLMAVLIIFNVLIFSYVFWHVINLYFITYNNHQRVLQGLGQDLIDYSAFRQVNAPVPLQIVGVRVIPQAGGSGDILVRVRNSNESLTVKNAQYTLFANGVEIASAATFILPASEKFLVAYNVANLGQAPNIQLQFNEVNWRRELFYEETREERLNFTILDTEYLPASSSSIAGQLPVSIARAEIRNDSAFSYWRVGFFIAAYSGQELVGVNYSTIEPFRSGETKSTEARWFAPLGNVSRIEVIPDVNILDPASIMDL